MLSLRSYHITSPDLASVKGWLAVKTKVTLQWLPGSKNCVASIFQFESAWSAGEIQGCVSELHKSGTSSMTWVLGDILSLRDRKAPRPAALQLWELEASAFHRGVCCQWEMISLNTAKSRIRLGWEATLPFTEVRFWLLWKGAVLCSQQLPNSAWSKHWVSHDSLGLPQVVNQWKNPPVLGTSRAVGAWRVFWPWQTGSSSKIPWVLNSVGARRYTCLLKMGCWPTGRSCSSQMSAPEPAHSPVPTGNQWEWPFLPRSRQLFLQRKNWQWAHIQNKKVSCHTLCTAGEKGDWLFFSGNKNSKKYLPQNLKGTSNSSFC